MAWQLQGQRSARVGVDAESSATALEPRQEAAAPFLFGASRPRRSLAALDERLVGIWRLVPGDGTVPSPRAQGGAIAASGTPDHGAPARAAGGGNCAEAARPEPPVRAMAELSLVEQWKAAKHGFDVWPDIVEAARRGTPHAKLDEPD